MNIVAQMPSDNGVGLLTELPVRTDAGTTVPLGTVVRIGSREVPDALGSWQGLPSVTIQGQQVLGVSLSAALAELNQDFRRLGQKDVSFGYSGRRRCFSIRRRRTRNCFRSGWPGCSFCWRRSFAACATHSW